MLGFNLLIMHNPLFDCSTRTFSFKCHHAKAPVEKAYPKSHQPTAPLCFVRNASQVHKEDTKSLLGTCLGSTSRWCLPQLYSSARHSCPVSSLDMLLPQMPLGWICNQRMLYRWNFRSMSRCCPKTTRFAPRFSGSNESTRYLFAILLLTTPLRLDRGLHQVSIASLIARPI